MREEDIFNFVADFAATAKSSLCLEHGLRNNNLRYNRPVIDDTLPFVTLIAALWGFDLFKDLCAGASINRFFASKPRPTPWAAAPLVLKRPDSSWCKP